MKRMSCSTDRAINPPDTDSGPDVARPRRRERRLSIALSGLAFFVSYVITAGPAVFMVRRFDMPMFGAIVEMLYAPLIFLVRHNVPVIGPLIKVWVSLFR